MSVKREDFGDDFTWGVSSAAFQIEGSHDADGKGLSIWDVFAARSRNIKGGHNAQIACDFYKNYREDVNLVKKLSIPNFRFSISWPRVMPEGTGVVNQKGIDYYDRLTDYLLERGITPWVTLYHWDLPNALERKGGWTNRDIVNWFADYSALCAQRLGDRVDNWMMMNEPSVFTGAGYFLGIHAPGKRGVRNYVKAIHHATLATAEGARAIRSICPQANIGTTFSMTHIEPATGYEKDVMAAKRVDTLLNRTFIEPLLGHGYPFSDLPFLSRMQKYIFPGDEKKLSFDFDFIGLQCYTREIVRSSWLVPYIGASLVKAIKRDVPVTDMKWEVYPQSIYHLLHKLNTYDNMPKIMVTENGAAFPDIISNGQVYDLLRTEYIQRHLSELLKAKQEGCKVDGYFVWTLTDNFEWAEGYHPRFGLVHVDFDTQQRIVKHSGLWYKSFLEGNSTIINNYDYEDTLCSSRHR